MLNYYITVGGQNERNLRSYYGVHVSGSSGLVGKPPFKDAQKYSWDYLNGEYIDLSTRRYKAREITLHCWIERTRSSGECSETAAVDTLNTFLKAFDTDGLVTLRISFDGSRALSSNLYYLVYLKESNVKYKWRKDKQIMEFDIVLVEPSPEKIVFQRMYAAPNLTATATFSSVSEFEIDWGDGNVSHDLVGTNSAVTHTYLSAGTYIIIVSGVTKDISISITNGNEQDHEEEER